MRLRSTLLAVAVLSAAGWTYVLTSDEFGRPERPERKLTLQPVQLIFIRRRHAIRIVPSSRSARVRSGPIALSMATRSGSRASRSAWPISMLPRFPNHNATMN